MDKEKASKNSLPKKKTNYPLTNHMYILTGFSMK